MCIVLNNLNVSLPLLILIFWQSCEVGEQGEAACLPACTHYLLKKPKGSWKEKHQPEVTDELSGDADLKPVISGSEMLTPLL